MRLSTHSRKRIQERANIEVSNQKSFYRAALNKGLDLKKSIYKGYDPIVKNYISSKQHKGKVKIYKGFTFIYGKNSKILYTMYKTPQNVVDAINKREEYKE